MRIHPLRLGLVAGIFLAVVHAAWATLVAVGWAQPLMKFVFWAHFIAPPYQIEPFEIGRAILLVGIAFTVGLVLGSVGAFFWNRLAHID